jgi:hypothetical protein
MSRSYDQSDIDRLAGVLAEKQQGANHMATEIFRLARELDRMAEVTADRDRLTRELAAAKTREAGLREALEDFVRWSDAYPTDIFIEPDYAKAHELLRVGGMTLDAITASVMRRAITDIGKRARAALAQAAPAGGE